MFNERNKIMFNATLVGNVGGDVETREVKFEREGEEVTATVASFSLAINDPFNREAEPVWVRINAWNGLAEIVSKFVQKGDQLTVFADKMRPNAWTDNEGNARCGIDVRAAQLKLDPRRAGQGSSPSSDINPDDAPF